MTNPSLPATGYIRLAQLIGNPKKGVAGILPVSRSVFYENLRSGRYKLTPVKLSERCTAYRVEEVRALLEALAEEAGA